MTPSHTVIIPHSNRTKLLARCIVNLDHALTMCWPQKINILVVNDCATTLHNLASEFRTIAVPSDGGPFNKAKFLNAGINATHGDLLTFLDCDAIVSPWFFANISRVDWSAVTRLCYRVRHVGLEDSQEFLTGQMSFADLLDLEKQGKTPIAYEAYLHPNRNTKNPKDGTPWGNSQFTIRRDALGDLRFDERYVGRGFEDIDLLCRLYKQLGPHQAQIVTDPVKSMFHLQHEYEPTWRTPQLEQANLRRFQKHNYRF